MLKMFVTDAGVSKGYDGAPALRFYDAENGTQCVRFRIGKKVYDSRVEGNHRWINLGVKAFGDSCERIRKMKLKEGSYINFIARYDEETWEDQTTHERKSAPILIVDEIEYSGGGGQKSKNATGTADAESEAKGDTESEPKGDAQPSAQEQPAASEASADGTMPDNFTGFDGFNGGGNPFF